MEYKKEKKSPKLKLLVRKHFAIKYKEQDNKFFFWKDLIQQYSYKKDMCIFVQDKTLLTENLQKELHNCFLKYYRISPKEVILTNISTKLEENKIDTHTFNTEYNKLKDKIDYYIDFLKEKKIFKYIDNSENNHLRLLIFKLLDNLMKNTTMGEQIEKDIYRSLELENAMNKVIQVSGIEKAICTFIRLSFKEEWYKRSKRQMIECLERTLAMNMNDLPLATKIKVLQLIEKTIPSPNYAEIRKLKKELKIKPLEFQIYLTAIPLVKKNSDVMKALDIITTKLNDDYKEHLLLPSQNKIFINYLRYLSTLIYFRDFVYDTKNYISLYVSDENEQYTLIQSLNLIEEMRQGKPKWDDNKRFKDVKEFINYLLQKPIIHEEYKRLKTIVQVIRIVLYNKVIDHIMLYVNDLYPDVKREEIEKIIPIP